jgi:transcriptional regulator with XRE-family HTH domain
MKPAKPTLGSLIRALRARNGWTLKEMSDRTGIPFSTLSKVEHDRLTLTYDKLQQLSERLHIRMSDLFAEPEGAATPVMARRSVGTVEQAVHVSTKNYDYYYLCPELRRKRMLPILTRVRAKSIEEFGELVRHAGEEFLYVLEGRVTVHTEFYDPVTLEPGQAIYIDSNMGHAYVAAEGCEEAMILGACSSQDEDQMEALLSAHGEAVEPAAPAVVDRLPQRAGRRKRA